MGNIKLTIEYDGTNYNGWQRQSSRFKTIQEEIEKAIKKITGRNPKLYGSGRTDSGVSAKGQVANFHTNSNLSLEKLRRGLNAVLPRDISIIKTEEVSKSFHSRFDAKSKIYRYTILNRNSQSPFLNRFCLHIPCKLNLSLMKKEAKILSGRRNFRAFAASGKLACRQAGKEKSTIRTIKRISVSKNEDSTITINIEADGFLYNMVRNIVGTLIEVGRGKFPPGSMKRILNAKDRTRAGPTAPAHGLCLMEVRY